jgi:release factor glutamine methyltransferase
MPAADRVALIDAQSMVRTALDVGTTVLREGGIREARVDAEWLLAEALGIARGRLVLHGQQALREPAAARYVQSLRRRLAREPVQHIVGTQAFRDLTLTVSGDTLVPRPETELLAGWAVERLPRTEPSLAIDLGTGSGCIACALAAERPRARVLAVDVSARAVAVARGNATALGLAGRVSVVESDLFAALPPVRADLVVSNPPYLPREILGALPPEVSQYDPALALDGGPDGLDLIRRIVDAAPAWLAPAGWLLLETAGGAQVEAVAALLQARGFAGIETRPDLAGIVRFAGGGMP